VSFLWLLLSALLLRRQEDGGRAENTRGDDAAKASLNKKGLWEKTTTVTQKAGH